MVKSRPQHPHFKFLLLLAVLFFLSICFNMVACSGQKRKPGSRVVVRYPEKRVRAAFVEAIKEVGGKIDPGSIGKSTITGSIEGYRFSLALKRVGDLSTGIRLRVSGGDGNESSVLESMIMKVLESKLSENRDKKSHPAMPAPSVAQYESATVCLYGSSNRETFQSSGIVITPDGLVMTTAHEISNARSLFVKWPDKRVFKGKIIFISRLYDLALVETHVESNSYIPLRSPESIEVPIGKRVYTFGCPYGLMGTLAQGRVAASPRVVGNILLYQCDLPVYPGNSGGPVFDSEGKLLGLVKGRLKKTDQISFIIPVFYLYVFFEENTGRINHVSRGFSREEGKDWAYWFGLGLAATSNSTKERAFRKVLSIRPRFVPALYHLGLIFNREGKLQEELRLWRELVSLVPGWSEAWYRLGNALFKSGDLDGAKNAYKRAVSLSPEDPRYYNNLGEIYRRERDFKRAEIYFKKALSLYPDYALAHYNLGILFDQELDKPELAVYHYKKYLELRPAASDREKVMKWIREAEKRF